MASKPKKTETDSEAVDTTTDLGAEFDALKAREAQLRNVLLSELERLETEAANIRERLGVSKARTPRGTRKPKGLPPGSPLTGFKPPVEPESDGV